MLGLAQHHSRSALRLLDLREERGVFNRASQGQQAAKKPASECLLAEFKKAIIQGFRFV